MKSMKNGKRGRVLILDNTVYYQNNRAGAQHDYENLQNFFKKMNMEIARGDDEDDDTFGKDCNAEVVLTILCFCNASIKKQSCALF